MSHQATVRCNYRSRQQKNKPSHYYLEALDQRVLLSVVTLTWTGLGTTTAWSDTGNWGGTPPNYPHNQGGDVYVAKFDNSGAVTVDITQDDTLDGIWLVGNSQVTLQFDGTTGATRTLSLLAYDFHQMLDFDQTNGNTTSLTVQTNGTISQGILSGTYLEVYGDTGGQSSLAVKGNATVSLADDITADNRRFDMTIDNAGTVEADNAWLLGKDTTVNGTSTINVSGLLYLDGTLRVGGDGKTVLNVYNSVDTGRLIVHNKSEVTVSGLGANFSTGHVDLGYPIAGVGLGLDGGPTPTIAAGQGAKLTIDDNASMVAEGISLVSGIQTTLTVEGDSTLFAGIIQDYVGDQGQPGPLVDVEGEGSYLIMSSTRSQFTVGGGFTYLRSTPVLPISAEMDSHYFVNSPSPDVGQFNSGRLVVTGGGNVIDYGLLAVGSYSKQPGINELLIGDGAQVLADVFTLGVDSPVGTGAYGHAVLTGQDSFTGDFSTLETTGTGKISTYLGDGSKDVEFAITDQADLVSDGTILKAPNALVTGNGKIFAPGTPMTTAGKRGDIAPGDYFTYGSNGNLISNGTNSIDALGTLTLNGTLDASSGFTLDSVLGTSGASSRLAVTGTVTLGGDFAGQITAVTSGVDSTTFTTSSSFTILTAAEIDDGFDDYTFGDPIIGDRDLPTLAPNLFWTLDEVTGSGTESLQLAVGSLTLSATASNWHTIVLATNAPTSFPTHLDVESGDDTTYHDVAPGYNTTISGWSPPTNLYSSTTYNYRLTANIDGQTFWATASATTLTHSLRPAQPTSFSATVDSLDPAQIDFTAANNTDSGYDEIQVASTSASNNWFDVEGAYLSTSVSQVPAVVFPDMLFRARRITSIDGTHNDASAWSTIATSSPGYLAPISGPTLASMIAIPGGYQLTINNVPELSGGGPGSGVYIEDLTGPVSNYKFPQQRELSPLLLAA